MSWGWQTSDCVKLGLNGAMIVSTVMQLLTPYRNRTKRRILRFNLLTLVVTFLWILGSSEPLSWGWRFLIVAGVTANLMCAETAMYVFYLLSITYYTATRMKRLPKLVGTWYVLAGILCGILYLIALVMVLIFDEIRFNSLRHVANGLIIGVGTLVVEISMITLRKTLRELHPTACFRSESKPYPKRHSSKIGSRRNVRATVPAGPQMTRLNDAGAAEEREDGGEGDSVILKKQNSISDFKHRSPPSKSPTSHPHPTQTRDKQNLSPGITGTIGCEPNQEISHKSPSDSKLSSPGIQLTSGASGMETSHKSLSDFKLGCPAMQPGDPGTGGPGDLAGISRNLQGSDSKLSAVTGGDYSTVYTCESSVIQLQVINPPPLGNNADVGVSDKKIGLGSASAVKEGQGLKARQRNNVSLSGTPFLSTKRILSIPNSHPNKPNGLLRSMRRVKSTSSVRSTRPNGSVIPARVLSTSTTGTPQNRLSLRLIPTQNSDSLIPSVGSVNSIKNSIQETALCASGEKSHKPTPPVSVAMLSPEGVSLNPSTLATSNRDSMRGSVKASSKRCKQRKDQVVIAQNRILRRVRLFIILTPIVGTLGVLLCVFLVMNQITSREKYSSVHVTNSKTYSVSRDLGMYLQLAISAFFMSYAHIPFVSYSIQRLRACLGYKDAEAIIANQYRSRDRSSRSRVIASRSRSMVRGRSMIKTV
ncbi:hypothetical protein AAMO2058_000963400 [Amorphochlora amoebiformis]|uniref:Uncharacterized protein n=1 Tax=Amorphochlora amoebiformis TaxID=1561963 RepID=A0A7S0H7R8_9EUKA|mmetsp:Transcript_9683/g.15312  ORF Transcript_9683/g.15312 Transcript_9683/m.15312 type:complete len:703 (+) Transcript_9683:59-2167(+)